MKKYTKISFLMLFTILAFVGCEENEDPIDDSLIIAMSTSAEYVIVSPSTGAVLAEVQPDVVLVNSLALGFQSNKAVIVSKEKSNSFVKVIYTCDRETGGNLFQVTSEQDWDVMFVDVSLAGPQIVFSAQNVDVLSDDNIHKINEDGTGYERLSTPNEIVDCQGVSTKIWSAYDPAWSPDGSKIAFDCHLREVGALHPHNSIAIMDANGQNKQVLYDVPVEETHYKDICWTKDGQFLIFLVRENSDVKVKALHVNSKAIVDITSHLSVEGLHVDNLWTAPNENKIIFNKYEPGGGDLYVIDFTVSDDQFQINGTYKMLASYQDNSSHFGTPDWQLWDGN